MSEADATGFRLRRAFAEYEQALQAQERAGILTARLALCRSLVESGWEPPPEVREQMQRDERAVRRLSESYALHASLLWPESRRVLRLDRRADSVPPAAGERRSSVLTRGAEAP